MSHRLFLRLAAASIGVVGCLAVTATARAELVSYDFTASVSQVDSAEAQAAGLPVRGTISGSFSYDTRRGWYGGSNTWADPSLQLTVNGVKESNSFSTTMSVEYNQHTLTMQEDANTSGTNYWATLVLTGQPVSGTDNGALPTSLMLGGSANGTLTLYLRQDRNSGDKDLVANLQTLTPSGSTKPVSTPELDPKSGAGALALALGGAGVLFGRRRRSSSLLQAG